MQHRPINKNILIEITEVFISYIRLLLLLRRSYSHVTYFSKSEEATWFESGFWSYLRSLHDEKITICDDAHGWLYDDGGR